ncbi:site-specific integrase [Bacillus sp. CH30_1T]|uniref:site-specific integrase n=1 Tax=Bacillus sp. CH30_1T TaxID=2604836 RepID=UPI00165DDED7|nr:site-specific integrase [Bacillus sp. CH30_1T]
MKGMMKMNKKPVRKFVPWSNKEVIEFLKVAELEGSGEMYKFVLSTGVRLGELLALTWDNVDFDKETLTVNKNAISTRSGEEQIEPLRSGSHTTALPSNLVITLKKYKEKQRREIGKRNQHKLNLVFPDKTGGVRKPSTVRIEFYRLIEKANVRKITFHDLRRMHAILLVNAGASLDLIKNRLRHSRIETTKNLLYKQISKRYTK